MTEPYITHKRLREILSEYEKVIGTMFGETRRDAGQALADADVRIMSRINDLADQLRLIDDRLADLEDTLAPALTDDT